MPLTAWEFFLHDTLSSALELARVQGLPVFPCFPNKHPTIRNWAHNASNDPERIVQWNWVGRLIGVPTGSISGIIGLDIDWRNHGDDWAIENMPKIPLTHINMSQSDGAHFIFRAPDYIVSSSNSRIAPGVDVQAEGKQIIWWPAHGYDTFNYDLLLAIWPDWLTELNRPPPDPERSTNGTGTVSHRKLTGLVETVAGAQQGNRNACLFWAACKMRESGLSEADAIDLLVAAAAQAGLGAIEAQRTVRSGFQTGRGN
jgi:hypothetical protein